MVYYKKATATRRKVGKSEVLGIKGLSKDDEFTHGQNVAVADYDDFIDFVNSSEDNEKIKKLSGENLKLKNDLEKLKEKLDEKDIKIEELQNKIIDIQEQTVTTQPSSYFDHKFIDTFERMDKLRDEVNQRNELLFGAQTSILNTIDDIVNDTVEKANRIIAENNHENQLLMIAAIEDVQKKYEQRDLYTSKAIENTVESLNEELHNISFWKLFRNRKDIDLQVDVSDLKESIPIDDSKKLLVKPNVEISSSEIKKNHKIYDLRQLWIDTTKDDEFEEPIDVDKENL